MLLNFRLSFRIIGAILFASGLFMLLPCLISIVYGSGDQISFLISSALCIGTGAALYSIRPPNFDVRKREGYLIVTLSWIFIGIFGSLPYYLHLDISIIDALFESFSGFTTTGASIFNDIEALPEGILFWRSLTQWLGGMGIIVFTVAVFPLLGIGGVELFVAEAPGPKSDKIHPRIKIVAIRLWLIYLSLTILLFLLLLTIGGMNFFDALNHALTTLSTGGFSTKNDGMAFFGPISHYIVIIFMLISGTNFTILYYLLKGRIKRALSSEEFKFYILFISLTIITLTLLVNKLNLSQFESEFRHVAFQTVSIITTTGYITFDYTNWGTHMVLIFFMLMFVGGCAGSTAGGVKMIRHLVIAKNSYLEYLRLLHPHAYIRLKIDKGVVQGRIITHILVFLLTFVFLFVIGTLFMICILNDDPQPFLTSTGSVATCLANVGPGIGSVGPAHNFANIPDAGKLLLSLFMVVGRLEIFTVLILFTPYFWKTK